MSMAPFFGVPGKLKTLLDRLTVARAANLDNCDASVQTVDNNVDTLLGRLTSTRAGYLDGAISSRASATALQTVDNEIATLQSSVNALPVGIVKNKAQGTATISGGGLNNVAHGISGIDVDKALVFVQPAIKAISGGTAEYVEVRINQLGSTNIQIYGGYYNGSTWLGTVVHWQVVEFY